VGLLILEDETRTTELLRAALTRAGFIVDSIALCREARAALETINLGDDAENIRSDVGGIASIDGASERKVADITLDRSCWSMPNRSATFSAKLLRWQACHISPKQFPKHTNPPWRAALHDSGTVQGFTR
jgi:hypothetical protein